jgi:hypothetical protein
MLANQLRQQITSIAVVSLLAGLLLTGVGEGFPAQLYEVANFVLYVLVTALALFVASGLLPFVWFAATRFQPRRARIGILLWWLVLIGLAALLHFGGIKLI